MLTLFFWLFSQRISTASLAIAQTKWNYLFKYWWKSTALCPPSVRSRARWVSRIASDTRDKESHFGLWEQLVSLGITLFCEGPCQTCCLVMTGEAAVSFSFVLANIGFHCATAEGTSYRSGCGSSPSPGVTPMAFRLFSCPTLGGFWGCRDLKPHGPYMQVERCTFLMCCSFFAVMYSRELWPQVLVLSCSNYGAEPLLMWGSNVRVNGLWWPHRSLGACGAEIWGKPESLKLFQQQSWNSFIKITHTLKAQSLDKFVSMF